MRILPVLSFIFLGLSLLFVRSSPVFASSVRVPILMYHYIGNNPNSKDTARNTLSVSPDKFEAQMSYLARNGYTPITLDTLYGIFNKQIQAPVKSVVLTFDDGYIDFYTTAFPILRKYNFHAVSFIPTGLMNQGYYMSWAQIKEIQGSGLVTFEAHSVIHSNLTRLSGNRLLKELQNSKNVLQEKTGYPVNFVAYPYGASNSLVQQTAQKIGYVGGVGTWYGKVSGPSMNMPRIRITGQMDLKTFASRLQ